ncbi:hypothetical protein BDW02DRAFT_383608 [Decorospora gaudefroyi]|uniref:Uncharacterized protein n=1 Tax=Decorospora gaudefroyi TaxID=184978 RepID=A0A6A5K7R9_9PLEO|nr:hypothetical protein BDW02DRAFT_383608 [Decorospora gaudefroyi]
MRFSAFPQVLDALLSVAGATAGLRKLTNHRNPCSASAQCLPVEPTTPFLAWCDGVGCQRPQPETMDDHDYPPESSCARLELAWAIHNTASRAEDAHRHRIVDR